MENTAVETVGMVKNASGPVEDNEKKYTEEDIARLESGDLTDPAVCSELLTAYYQNDTPKERRFRLIRDLNVFVPETRLREKLAVLEAIENPSAEIRGDRLRILSRLAMLRKQHDGQGAEYRSERSQPTTGIVPAHGDKPQTH